MSDDKRKAPSKRVVKATVKLDHRMIQGKDHFALKQSEGIAGPCDGQPDGTPCGEGCTCIAGQPWYNPQGLIRIGIELDD